MFSDVTGWQEFTEKYGPGQKIKLCTTLTQLWTAPPGARVKAMQVRTKWGGTQTCRGREFVVTEKLWGYYTRVNGETNFGMWCQVKVGPGSAFEDIGCPRGQPPRKGKGKPKGKGKAVEAAPPTSPQMDNDVSERAWVNTVLFDLGGQEKIRKFHDRLLHWLWHPVLRGRPSQRRIHSPM